MSLLYCPRCEKPLDGHDQTACNRRMSRRFFFGMGLGVMAAVAIPKPKLSVQEILRADIRRAMVTFLAQPAIAKYPHFEFLDPIRGVWTANFVTDDDIYRAAVRQNGGRSLLGDVS